MRGLLLEVLPDNDPQAAGAPRKLCLGREDSGEVQLAKESTSGGALA